MATDRTFIEKYDSFIFTVRKILYYGDAYADSQPTDPKHDRWRFINYFGYDINHEFYDTSNDTFDFDNDDMLKDEFANIFCYKSLNITQLGDMCNLFRNLTDIPQSAEQLSKTRSKKNINRRLSKDGEPVQSGSVLCFGKGKNKYCKNVDIADGFEDKAKLVKALDFAVKKNNYSAFASSYKKLLVCRDGIENEKVDIEIEHQLFHPILDEIHIWEIVCAITEMQTITFKYCVNYEDATELFDFENLIPLKLVYETTYGRTYLFCKNSDLIQTFRVDRIFSVQRGKQFEEKEFSQSIDIVNSALEKAWLASTNQETIYHTVLRFLNTYENKMRVMNEGRHGKIAKEDEKYFYFEVDINDYFEITNWVLSFGSECTVLEPPELIDKVLGHLEEMAK